MAGDVVCPFCNQKFINERILHVHQARNRLCINIQTTNLSVQEVLRSRRYAAFKTASARRAAEQAAQGEAGAAAAADEQAQGGNEENINGQCEGEAGAGAMDIDDEQEDEGNMHNGGEIDPQKLTHHVIHALRTAGPDRTPLPQKGMDVILKIISNPTFNPHHLTVKNGSDVLKYIDNMWESEDGAFLRKVVSMKEDGDPAMWGELDLWAADPLQAVKDMVESKEAATHVVWIASDTGTLGNPMTAARALRRQIQIQELHGGEVHYLPILVYSDETHLDVHGHHKGHPVMVKLAGWKRDFWYDRRASRLVMLLPNLPTPVDNDETEAATPAIVRTEKVKQRKYEVFHEAIHIVFKKLKELSYG
jgi:Plavaka transposase